MKRVVMVAVLALFAGCADGLTAPKEPPAGAIAKRGAPSTDVYCFIEMDGCVPYVPPQPPEPPPPPPLVPGPNCHYELYMDANGQLYDVLVCS